MLNLESLAINLQGLLFIHISLNTMYIHLSLLCI